MAAEVRALRWLPEEVALRVFTPESTSDRRQETDLTFCGNARFKERPPVRAFNCSRVTYPVTEPEI